MDDTLKQRLIGAGALLATAFVLASLLPEPQLQPAADSALRSVTIDLAAPPGSTLAAIEAAEAARARAQAEAEARRAVQAQLPPPPGLAAATAGGSGNAPDAGTRGSLAEAAASETAAADSAAPEIDTAPQPAARPAERAAAPPTPTPATQSRREPPATGQAAATQPPAPASGSRWWVQIGSYSDIGNARQVEARLRELRQSALIAPIETERGTLYRVRSGPYASEEAAAAAQTTVVAAGFADARVIRP